MLYVIVNNMIYSGFLLVAAMLAGLGLTIAVLAVATILLHQFATRFIEDSAGGIAVARFSTLTNSIGALLVLLSAQSHFLLFSAWVEP